MGCPSAELMTSSLHSDVRIAGLAFDVALHDSLAEICITLSRILQVQCKWWNTGVSHCTTSEKNVHYGACAYGFFFHFLPSCSIQTFIYYGKKDSSCTQCDGWQTPCGLQGRIKWNISNIFMYLFFPRWGKDRWACPYCVTLLTQHCSLWMFRSIFWLYPFKKNQLPLTIVGLLYDEQELLVKENQHL